MEMLSFDLRGKFAHFRKYFANNTAFSFSIPPRTTLMGITAALLGRPRDSYYQELGPDRIRYGIRVIEPVKKEFHRLNLLMIKGASDFRGQKGRVQTPFEIITGRDLRNGEVAYRVYLSPKASGKATYDSIINQLKDRKQVYNLTLGPAFCTAYLSNVQTELNPAVHQASPDHFLSIHSAIRTDQIKEIQFNEEKLLVEEELLPAAFVDDYNRELSSMQRVLFSTDGRPLHVKIEGEYLAVNNGDETEFITMLDE